MTDSYKETISLSNYQGETYKEETTKEKHSVVAIYRYVGKKNARFVYELKTVDYIDLDEED